MNETSLDHARRRRDEAGPRPLAAVEACVTGNRRVCERHHWLALRVPHFPASQPGQFLQLRCGAEPAFGEREVAWPADGFPSFRPKWNDPSPFLLRPFSIADEHREADGSADLAILVHAVGRGSQWLADRQPGDKLSLTGPLGRGFSLPARPTPVVLVGGGVGIPPLIYLTRRLQAIGCQDVTAIFGARTASLLPLELTAEPATDGTPRPCLAWPTGAAYSAILTTDDGSLGLRGLVTDGLEAWLARRGQPAGVRVYACGPDPMLKAVARATRERGLACELCIERLMGCGLGACLSCIVRRRDPTRREGWRWALACAEGPVFDRGELLDYDAPGGT